jgi:hypothetical protein
MHIEHIAPRKGVKVPHMVKQFFSREHYARLAHKALKKGELLKSKRHLFAFFAHYTRSSVHLKRPDLEHEQLGAALVGAILS